MEKHWCFTKQNNQYLLRNDKNFLVDNEEGTCELLNGKIIYIDEVYVVSVFDTHISVTLCNGSKFIITDSRDIEKFINWIEKFMCQ